MSVLEHSATIIKTEKNRVYAAVNSRAACASCSVRKSCGLAECREKVIEIETPEAEKYSPGDRITVELDEKKGWLAVFLAYILPLLLVLAVLLTGIFFLSDETAAAVFSLTVLLPYYLVLGLFSKKISREIRFKISQRPPF